MLSVHPQESSPDGEEDLAQVMMTLRSAGFDSAEEDDDDIPYGRGTLWKFPEPTDSTFDGDSETNALSGESSGSSDDEGRHGAPFKFADSALADAGDPEATGLVDLDPAEGRRRGDVLLSMLAEKPAEDAAPQPAKTPLRSLARNSVPFDGTGAAAHASWALGQHQTASAASCSTGLYQPASTAFCSTGPGACMVTRTLRAATVWEAASRAFGCELAGVEATQTGFAVWLTQRRHDQEALVDALTCALWPLVSLDVIGMERQVSSTGPGTRPCGRSGLTVWCLSEAAGQQGFCWDFARRGCCPRSFRCRWLHAVPPSHAVRIELVS